MMLRKKVSNGNNSGTKNNEDKSSPNNGLISHNVDCNETIERDPSENTQVKKTKKGINDRWRLFYIVHNIYLSF